MLKRKEEKRRPRLKNRAWGSATAADLEIGIPGVLSSTHFHELND